MLSNLNQRIHITINNAKDFMQYNNFSHYIISLSMFYYLKKGLLILQVRIADPCIHVSTALN